MFYFLYQVYFYQEEGWETNTMDLLSTLQKKASLWVHVAYALETTTQRFLPVDGASEKHCILTRDLQGQAEADVLSDSLC